MQLGNFYLQRDIAWGPWGHLWQAQGREGTPRLIQILPESVDRVGMGKEIAEYRNLSHPNLNQILEVHLQHEVPHLVLRDPEAPSLESHLDSPTLHARQVFQWGGQIIEALNYLHQHHLVHGDIHPSTIAVLPNQSVSSSTLGSPAVVVPFSKTNTLTWPPEVVAHKRYSTASDVYAVGVLLNRMGEMVIDDEWFHRLIGKTTWKSLSLRLHTLEAVLQHWPKFEKARVQPLRQTSKGTRVRTRKRRVDLASQLESHFGRGWEQPVVIRAGEQVMGDAEAKLAMGALIMTLIMVASYMAHYLIK